MVCDIRKPSGHTSIPPRNHLLNVYLARVFHTGHSDRHMTSICTLQRAHIDTPLGGSEGNTWKSMVGAFAACDSALYHVREIRSAVDLNKAILLQVQQFTSLH